MKHARAFTAAAVACLPFLGGLRIEAALPATETRPAESSSIVVPECRIRLIDEVQLSCERSGILDEVVAEGGTVRQGESVARIRDHLIRAACAIAEAEAENDVEVRFARKAVDLAQLKYVRSMEANKAIPGTVSELELGELRLGAEKALLQLEQAEHQFAIAGLKRDEIRAT